MRHITRGDARRQGVRSELGLVVAVPAVAGTLVAGVAGAPLPLAIVVAAAPAIALAAAALSVRSLTVLLVVSAQICVSRIALFGFNFLPEHFVLALVLAALVVRSPHAVWRRPAAYEMLLLALVGWSGVTSLLLAKDPEKSLAIVGWMLLAWLIMWTVRGVFFLSEGIFRDCVKAGASVAGIFGAIGFILWVSALLGITSVLVQPEYVTGSVGATGPMLEANLFGASQLFWLYWLLRQRVLGKVPMPAWQTVALILGIVASMTRAVWLAAILVVIGCLYLARRPAKGASNPAGRPGVPGGIGVVLAGLLLTLVVAFFTPAGLKFTQSLNLSESTGRARVTNWKLAWTDLDKLDGYVSGLGTNSYGQRHLSRTLRGQPDYLGNLPLTVLYDSGVVGVILFLGGFTAFIFRSRDPATRLMSLLFVIALLVVGAATSPIWFGFVWVFIAAIDADSGDRGTVALPAEESGARAGLVPAGRRV